MDWIWIGVIISLILIELLSLNFTSIWFVISAIISFILLKCNQDYIVQVISFLVVGMILILIVRPKIIDKLLREKLEIKDLTTGRTYSTGWAEKLKADKFNSIMVHGYTIKDNGNGIVDENDTIEGKDLEKPMSLYEFLNPMTES